MEASADYTWTPPEFDLSRPPARSALWNVTSHTSLPGNFARSAKWCPDGSAALVQCEHREFWVLDPRAAESAVAGEGTSMSWSTTDRIRANLPNFPSCKGSASNLPPVRTLPQPAPILDYAWYPTASATNPASFCFVASVRETPVKLLDASDGRLRASYPIVDHRERQIAPHSLAFNLSGTSLYCGFEDAIEVFDLGRPGEGTRLPTSPSKKSRDGLKGIISALAFSPSYDSDFYAAGSLAATAANIAMFSEADGAIPVLFVGGGPRAGVTQLHFNPTQPHLLYAAFRRRREVYSWDLRADVSNPVKIYSTSSVGDPPVGDTNQKRRFDVDVAGRFLAVGDQEGNVNVFDLSSSSDEGAAITYPAHSDAIGGVTFHPTAQALLSVSGSRHFRESGSDSSDDGDDGDGEGEVVRRGAARPTPVPIDASIKLWDFGIQR
ncbi:WD40-repeat-containing domain protein [Mycena maculata]|uniref:WD40-repeat-containing domain protein n=1 Tax=Mycena maculata TaxID=230809 RepID=A0AAD7JEJ8_9AGAR|nr:WD40-repeat-containing domain protein [Mycena maculata]